MSVAWWDGVTITVEVAFATDPLADTPTWTDVSDYVRDIQIDRGRRDEFSQFGPGTASVTFSNRDRRFDPNYSSGPYYGDLLPMKKIRIQATYSAVTYDRFVGFVQGWPQDYEFTFDSTVTVRCVDGTRFLASGELAQSAYEAAVMADSPVHYWPMQEQATTVTATYEDIVSGVPLPLETTLEVPTPPTLATIPQMVDSLAASSVTFTYPLNSAATGTPPTSTPYGLSLWCKPSATPTAVFALQAQISSASGDGGGFLLSFFAPDALGVQYSNTTDNKRLNVGDLTIYGVSSNQYTHIGLWYDGTNVKAYVNGVLSVTVATSAGVVTGPDVVSMAEGGFSHLAVFPSGTEPNWATQYVAGVAAYGHPYGERSGDRIGRVLDEIAWPAADRTLGNGDTVHGPYLPGRQSAIAYMQDVAVAEDGLLFVGRDGNVVLRDRQFQWTATSAGTFSDDGSDIPYEGVTIDANSIEPMRTNVTVAYGASGGYIKVRDATAVTTYGPLIGSLSAPTVESAAQARALANYKLRTTKDPLTRITELRVQPRAKAATAYPVLLGLEIGDRIVVERTPGNPVVGSQIVQSVTVQGYSESITREGVWLTSLYLSPAPDTYIDGPYLLTNDATYGKTGAVAGNKVAF